MSEKRTITRLQKNILTGYLSVRMTHKTMEACVHTVEDALAAAGIKVEDDDEDE